MTAAPEALDWLRLYRSENVGPATFFRLIERFGTAAKALDALPELAGRGGKKISVYPKEAAERELAGLRKVGADLLIADDPRFPEALKARRFVVRQRPIGLGMEVAALLRLPKLGPDGH